MLRDASDPGELRFYRSLPSVAIGLHQRFDQEVRFDYCRRQGIDWVRRPTGGGALYVDPGQLAWTLVASSQAPTRMAARLCQAVAEALGGWGIDAVFRWPNDIEVGGRKVASGFLARIEGKLLFHGSLLLHVDIERMLCALRVPAEKLSPDGLAGARQRVVGLDELLGAIPALPRLRDSLAEALSGTLRSGPVREAPADWEDAGPAVGEDDDLVDLGEPSLEGLHKTAASWLRASLRLDRTRRRIERAWVGGDVMVHPSRLFARVRARLAGARVDRLEPLLERFFRSSGCDPVGFTLGDVRQVLRRTLDRVGQQRAFGLAAPDANRLMVLSPRRDLTAAAIVSASSVMLVPYCAKPLWCKWRLRDGCTQCGCCEVGEAYRLGEARGLRVISIRNFEHLRGTLRALKRQGVQAFVGMCCQIFIKRHKALQEAGLPMVLMDIAGSTCYELQQEEQAYAGRFQAQARLDLALLGRKVLAGSADSE
jgi:lipoate-protein ligase A